MCGIIGFAGRDQAAPILLDGLERMEYRGYDSAGIAVRSETRGLQVRKAKGRLKVLAELTHGGKDLEGTLGIGHTRWATHGEPNDINAHPHVSENGQIALVHNGIIENYLEIKEHLLRQGVTFIRYRFGGGGPAVGIPLSRVREYAGSGRACPAAY